ncbi:MAG: hypothetical protein SO435_06620 [Peptostreptococcus porci]|nr:hypothetical protein [Peptostreptococcus porci]
MQIDKTTGKYILNKQEKEFLLKNKDKKISETAELFNKKYNFLLSYRWISSFYNKRGIYKKRKEHNIYKTNSEKIEFKKGCKYGIYEISIDNNNKKKYERFIGNFNHLKTYKHHILFEGKNGVRESFLNNRQLYRFEKVS